MMGIELKTYIKIRRLCDHIGKMSHSAFLFTAVAQSSYEAAVITNRLVVNPQVILRLVGPAIFGNTRCPKRRIVEDLRTVCCWSEVVATTGFSLSAMEYDQHAQAQ